MKSRRLSVSLATLLAVALGMNAVCSGGNKVSVGRNVSRRKLVSMDQIKHSVWDELLERYVDDRGNVAYSQWQKSAADTRALDAYLAALSAADPQSSAIKPAQVVFWINAYNAVTVRGILREYPTTSIRNHTPKVFGYNIWYDLLLTVGGRQYSLHQMEHEILRKMGEPRIHFAIVCASRSCPRLSNEAYAVDKLEDQLTNNTNVFFANPGNFRFDPGSRRMQLSSIVKWFSEDFGDGQAAQLRTIAPYLPNRRAHDAALANAVVISYLKYDWLLNDQATAGTVRP